MCQCHCKIWGIVCLVAECGLFSDFAAGLTRTSNLHDVIFVDMVHYPLVNRKSLITDLHKHVYCNIFKVLYMCMCCVYSRTSTGVCTVGPLLVCVQ